MEVVWKVATEIHRKGSRGSQNRTREYARSNGVKRMSQIKFDREVVELKERLSKVTELLHEEVIGVYYYIWRLKNKVKWPVKRLCARDLKHKHSVWVKEEERLRAAKHEEVHVICEPEQGEYLDEEGEDANTEFTSKLMDMEKSSYQYTEENEDVDVRSFEGRKDYFA